MDLISQLVRRPALRIFDTVNNVEVLSELKVSRVSIKYSSIVLEHRLESGKTEIDSRVIKPTRLAIDLIAPDVDSLEEVNRIILDRAGLYSIQSKGLQFESMKISPVLITQSGQNTSSTPMRIEFYQTLMENQRPVIFEFAADSSILKRGVAVMNQAADDVGSLFDKVSSAASRGYDQATDTFSRFFER